MNIVNKLTIRHLKKNKRRTLITIIGVIISVAMITAVATLATSFINLAQKQQIANYGEWHVLYKDVNEEQLKEIEADDNTDKIILSRDLGYSYLANSENTSKPYLFFKQYNADGFKNFPIEVIEGKVPEKADELLISEHVNTNGQMDFKIGDIISPAIGNRVAQDIDLDNEVLDQTFSLQTMGDEVAETIEETEEKQFTIVGVMKRPMWEPYSAPGFTALSYIEESDDPVNASVVWKKVNQKTREHAVELGEQLEIEDVSVNKDLLRFYGIFSRDSLKSSLYEIAAIILSVIIIGSVSLIYNAFAISVSERSRHLGMLASVGATKKQKRNSVFFEGFIIGMISIPIGIISGIGGIAVTFYYINPLFEELGALSEGLTVVVTSASIIVAILVSVFTIFISTYIPARRASKISAIDAIRQTADIKLSRKSVKTSKLVRKLFGIEAEFGLKNLKRNKRRYIATVFSLVISIILFLSVSFFGDQMRTSTDHATSGQNYDMKIASMMNSGEFSPTLIDSITSIEEVTRVSELAHAYANTNLNADQVAVSLEHFSGSYMMGVDLNVLGEDDLKAYANEVGVPYNQLTDEVNVAGIVINTAKAADGKFGEVQAVNMDPKDQLELSYYDWEKDEDINVDHLEVAALTDIRPPGINLAESGNLHVVISQAVFDALNQSNQIELYRELVLTTADPLVTHEKVERIIDTRMFIENPYQQQRDANNLILLMSVFTYGFIALITLISVANIFNTISTSISLRQGEFGMLKSVGMTPKGFNRMINYESLFYGIQSLLFGLPISIGIMYAMYYAMSEAFDYPFQLPWGSIIGVIIGVFLIVGSAMLYSSAKVKKENIIDALKQENI